MKYWKSSRRRNDTVEISDSINLNGHSLEGCEEKWKITGKKLGFLKGPGGHIYWTLQHKRVPVQKLVEEAT